MSAPKVRRIKVNLLLPMISSNPAACGTRGAISEVRSNRDAWRCADRSIASSRPLADPGQVIGWIRAWDRGFQAASNPLRRGMTLALGLIGIEMWARRERNILTCQTAE